MKALSKRATGDMMALDCVLKKLYGRHQGAIRVLQERDDGARWRYEGALRALRGHYEGAMKAL